MPMPEPLEWQAESVGRVFEALQGPPTFSILIKDLAAKAARSTVHCPTVWQELHLPLEPGVQRMFLLDRHPVEVARWLLVPIAR
jgi:hypothetical protein